MEKKHMETLQEAIQKITFLDKLFYEEAAQCYERMKKGMQQV